MRSESLPVVDPELSRERTVDPEEVCERVGAGAVFGVSEIRIADALHRRDQDRHVLGTATGHHAIDGNVPWCGPLTQGRKHRDLLVGRIIGIFQELFDPLLCRRSERKAVAPAPLCEMAVDLIDGACEYDLPGVPFLSGDF